MTKPTAPTIERLKFKDLNIDNLYSGRSEKEINENAKDKTKELAAFGGWNPAMPGQYFETSDGTKCLLAGFSRVKASIINGEDSGYFVRVEGDVIDHLLACETTNSVRPLSPLSRGARYSELREGKLAEDFKEALADPKNPKHWERQPMNTQDIADRIGKTRTWVDKCIAIFEAPPEVRDLLESDKIAVTVAEGARSLANKHHNGSDAKVIAICRRAFAYARSDDKDTATKQHFEAIKSEFIPEKKLKAATPAGEESENKGNGASSKPAKQPADEKEGDTAKSDSKDATEQLPSESDTERLFQEQTQEVMQEGSKKNSKLKEAWKTILMDPDNLEEMTLEPETVEALVEKLHAAMIAARDVF